MCAIPGAYYPAIAELANEVRGKLERVRKRLTAG